MTLARQAAAGDRRASATSPPRPWPTAARPTQRPLHGLRVLDLTHILAGPVAGGAHWPPKAHDVMLVNRPHLPNYRARSPTPAAASAPRTSTCARPRARARCSACCSTPTSSCRATARAPSQRLGYAPQALARIPAAASSATRCTGLRPRRAVRRASAASNGWCRQPHGFNLAEARRRRATRARPRRCRCRSSTSASGYLHRLRHRRPRSGGSRAKAAAGTCRSPLAQTGHWLRGLRRVEDGATPSPATTSGWRPNDGGCGRLMPLRHAARFEQTPAG